MQEKDRMDRTIAPTGDKAHRTILHDLAKQADFDYVTARLGGEALIKQKYEHVYKALTNRNPIAKSTAARNTEGEPVDSMKIRTLNFDLATTLETTSSINLVEENPSVVIVGEMIDQVAKRTERNFAVYENNTHTLFGGAVMPSAQLIRERERFFAAVSTFYWTAHDDNGRELLLSKTESTSAVKVNGATTLVHELHVESPQPVRHTNGKKTTIYYNRKGIISDADWDYYFENVKIKQGMIDVFLPFKGSALFDEAFPPSFVDKNDGFKLQIENIKNGVAEFSTAHWNEIKWEIDGPRIGWEFPHEWYSPLAQNNLGAANDLNFYCKMVVVTKNGVQVPLVIQSQGESHEDPSYQKIPPIDLVWGCLGKDSTVRMADKQLRPITAIRPGMQVVTSTGTARVRDVISGTEETMLLIRTTAGNQVLVTKGHPVKTEDGLVPAQDLTAGSRLCMEYGIDDIEELHPVPYRDTVFSLDLESDGVFLANGFYVGDFRAQNRVGKDAPQLTRSRKLTPLQEEIAELVTGLERGAEHG